MGIAIENMLIDCGTVLLKINKVKRKRTMVAVHSTCDYECDGRSDRDGYILASKLTCVSYRT